jgi:hypothetical protein
MRSAPWLPVRRRSLALAGWRAAEAGRFFDFFRLISNQRYHVEDRTRTLKRNLRTPRE